MAHTRKEWSWHEGLITAIAVGGTFILLGLVVILTPNFSSKFGNFIGDFTFIYYPFGTGTISFPAPQNPAMHLSLFTAAMNFAVGIAVLQVVILPLRLALKSRLSRIAETVGNLVFWAGAALVANVYLLTGTVEGWFQFWAFLIILAGVSLIVRGAIQFSRGFGRRQETGQLTYNSLFFHFVDELLLNICAVWFRCTIGVSIAKARKRKITLSSPSQQAPTQLVQVPARRS